MQAAPINLVYLIDDDLIYQSITPRLIEIYQFAERVESFHDGLSAMRHLGVKLAAGQDIPNIIFLDLNMPIMSGWEFMAAFHTLPKPPRPIQIYIVSSSEREEDRQMMNEYPELCGYIVKPIAEGDFRTIWQNFMTSGANLAV
jgi:CheY-like chemotaxis protein